LLTASYMINPDLNFLFDFLLLTFDF
jgi:hypothetical protein